LFDDLGSHHRAITTRVPAAQQYFDQGLRLVYGFNHDEAERAFREAARLDPASAMAWWGVAVSLGPNINLPLDAERNKRAVDAVREAQSRLAGATEVERALVAAIATRYVPAFTADRAALDESYSKAMRDLHQRFPQDDDAAVLFAESLMDLKPWQLWHPDGTPAHGTDEIVRTLEAVLARSANHPGANHYLIHAVEASPKPDRASASAERLKTLVPGAGHLVHMPAHIQMRTGDYQATIDSNARAARADEAYVARTKADGIYPMMYYTHNLQFLSTAAGMLGQCAAAVDAADRAAAVVAPMVGHDPAVEYPLPWPLFARVRCERWDELLARPAPGDDTPATKAFWHYAQGVAHVAKGNREGAAASAKALAAAIARVPKDQTLNLNRAHDLLAISASVLNGHMASAQGRYVEAAREFAAAVAVQDTLRYDEPPAWFFPVREALGAAYLRAGHAAAAEAAFRRDLEINPRNPRSLFGLREAMRAQSKPDGDLTTVIDAAWVKGESPLTMERVSGLPSARVTPASR
jgi:tetratricopeptide (TPR) repeat protein